MTTEKTEVAVTTNSSNRSVLKFCLFIGITLIPVIFGAPIGAWFAFIGVCFVLAILLKVSVKLIKWLDS
jgi:hypothetical protein